MGIALLDEKYGDKDLHVWNDALLFIYSKCKFDCVISEWVNFGVMAVIYRIVELRSR